MHVNEKVFYDKIRHEMVLTISFFYQYKMISSVHRQIVKAKDLYLSIIYFLRETSSWSDSWERASVELSSSCNAFCLRSSRIS